jgi:hypothetical protein
MNLNTKDYIEITYWAISLIGFIITIYVALTMPIRAVLKDRELQKDQNKYNAKLNLFLMLFSLRGKPKHHEFVMGLNQIYIVYEDVPEVLDIWEKMYTHLQTPDQNNFDTYNLLKTDLLSAMAQYLDYKKIPQTSIQKVYYPEAHDIEEKQNQNYQNTALKFFETGVQANETLIDFYKILALKQTGDES